MVKASALRKIFGREPMVIGSFDGSSVPRDAQGPKSQAFHFSARICASCNSSQTQAPDREFDRFNAFVSELISQGKSPESVFSLPQYELSSTPYLNVFRYFAKLLCCHVAESGGPRALAVSEFALGRAGRNTVCLYIDADPTYETFYEQFGEHKFAGHGGLMVPVDSKNTAPHQLSKFAHARCGSLYILGQVWRADWISTSNVSPTFLPKVPGGIS